MEGLFSLSSVNNLFGVLVAIIGLGVFIYSFFYMKSFSIKDKAIYYISLILFTISMFGIIYSSNLLLLYLFWEMTSITSFFLIGLKNEDSQVREKAKWALYTTVGGGLFLLFGILLISQIGVDLGLSFLESFNLSSLIKTKEISSHDYFKVSLVTIFIGISSKSALFPFSYWLPLAMAGPTPVSSFLHSATMVKAGLILGVKLFPLYAQDPLWQILFIGSGTLTVLHGGFQCLLQSNFKTMLAYSTICILGMLAILLGIANEYSITSFVLLVIAHAFYKASLFQYVGYFAKALKTMDRYELVNGDRVGILPFIVALLSTMSMVGIPLSVGFYAKEYIYLTAIKSYLLWILIPTFFLGNLFMGIQAINLLRVSWPQMRSYVLGYKGLLISPLIYSLIALSIALAPNILGINLIAQNAVGEVGLSVQSIHIKSWHGLKFPYGRVLVLSIITILGSVFGSIVLDKYYLKLDEFSKKYSDFSPWYRLEKGLYIILDVFKRMNLALQNGNFAHYIRITLGFLTVLILTSHLGIANIVSPKFDFSISKFLSLSGILAGLTFAYLSKSNLKAILYFVLSGFFLVLFFGYHSAADVSMTQLMVETLSLFFVFFLIKAVPIDGRDLRINIKPINFVIAFLYGVSIFIFSMAKNLNFDMTASRYFFENSKPLAKGENVVNVILVDYRAMDTFGEVLVVAIAIVGVLAIFSKRGERE
ncbi:hydrogen gas-evolving membrane-bound hydrogenase subunit E [Bacteriovorax sp. BAL6_X]|uniref:hydrogen gas-evolving membrane-bound hydrogenase subunit E n=1 Tax=Bacteriovorax sp. BAL6_X TaxID=1201290 RepID=UPI0005901D1F|nr:hydrogen gas-evolving membrane-bound hydrogenase subunit E [Bacteriovorax sp. BAL6_X]